MSVLPDAYTRKYGWKVHIEDEYPRAHEQHRYVISIQPKYECTIHVSTANKNIAQRQDAVESECRDEAMTTAAD